MRVLIFHGYLLRGTGSNVYNANLAGALVRLGHEVHLLCQEREPESLPFVGAVAEYGDGTLTVRALRGGVQCTVYRPDIGGLLPVYVADRYEGIEARTFPELSDAELGRYIDRNVEAVQAVVQRARPDVALANHLVMGPAILARALAGTGIPFAVKIHGSALEYTVKPHPARFMSFAREGLDAARAVLVGSSHTAESLWEALGDPGLPARTRLGPPGVDVHEFGPREPADAAAGLQRLAQRLEAAVPQHGATGSGDESAFARDAGAGAAAMRAVAQARGPLVAFVGKLIVSKGIDLLLAAWPLVLARLPRARLVVVGFGAYHDAARQLVASLAAGDLEAVRELAAEGRAAEGGPRSRLAYLEAFLDGLDDDARASYIRAASTLEERVVFTGRLEHEELAELLPACDSLVVPSTFPEAFGMVAVEAAACGALPVCASHSGLAEVSAALSTAVGEPARTWLSFPLGASAIPGIAERVCAWLEAPAAERDATRAALVAITRERYSWEGVAGDVIAAASGRLDELAPVPGPTSADAPRGRAAGRALG